MAVCDPRKPETPVSNTFSPIRQRYTAITGTHLTIGKKIPGADFLSGNRLYLNRSKKYCKDKEKTLKWVAEDLKDRLFIYLHRSIPKRLI